MHSGDKLTGTICKCMGCAKTRNRRIEREALLREPGKAQAFDLALVQNEKQIADAKEAQRAIVHERYEFLNGIRDLLVAEESK